MTKTTKTPRASKTAERKTTPGLHRLRKSANAETIRSAVRADQENGRAEALARIEAAADAIDLPAAFVLGGASAPQPPADAPAPVSASDAPADAATPTTAAPAPAAPFNDGPALTMTGFKRGVPVPPTPVPTPAEKMPGMSRKNAALYLAAAAGQMPTPPDFSAPSYAPDRKKLAELVALAEAGDVAGLRAYSVRVYYSAALELDRYRHRAIIAPGWRPEQADGPTI